MKSAALKSVFLFGLNFLQSCNIVRLLRFEKRLATVQVKKADTAYYPYTFNDNRMYVIGQVQAGEKKDSLIFSFDTGALTMIDEAAADKMKWDKTPSRVQPRASHFKFKSRFYLLPELTFELGGKSFQKSWTGSFSLNADSNSCNRKKEQGIIGSDILSQGVFCLDPYQKKYAIIPNDKFNVPSDTKGYSLPCHTSSITHIPFVDFTMGTHTQRAMWDLGYNGCILIQYPEKRKQEIQAFMHHYSGATQYTYTAESAMRDMENKGFGAGECDFLILDSVQIGRQTFYGSFRILLMQNDKLKRIKVNIGSDFIFRFQSWLNYKERKIALIPLPASQQFPTPPPEIKLDQQMHISALLKGGSYEKQCVRLHDCLLRIDDKNLSDILRGISSCEQVAFVLEALKHARQCLFSSTDGASKTVLIR